MNFNQLFIYNPRTGILRWKVSRSNRIKAGEVAGTVKENHAGKPYSRKYLQVNVDYRLLYVHRLIYQMVTGCAVPKGKQIDHKNGDGTDNRWLNLRVASRSQNMGNRDRNRTRKRNLPKGIQWHERDQLYVARFGDRNIKYSKSLKTAVAARRAAALAYYGEFAREEPP
jgi:HNH endonuclease